MLSRLFAVLLLAHGLIHLMGFVKAFGLAAVPQLTRQPSRAEGVLWLAASLLFVTAAVALFGRPGAWWVVGACAVVLSQVAIASSWQDARFGTIANVIALAGVIFGALTYGPGSLRAEYEGDVDRSLARPAPAAPLTEADLGSLPAAVRKYVRASGAVGQPRVRNFRAHLRGRIRGGPNDPWMPFTSEQFNTCGDDPGRLFYMNASRAGLPIQVLHVYAGPAATMRVKLAALLPLVDARGPQMDLGETVTLFNDMCVFAPATLADPRITWRELDARRVAATFFNAGHTVRAVLSFDDAGRLVDFVSDDRAAASPDGRSFTLMRWSTPLSGYRAYGSHVLAGRGECLWHAPGGTYPYLTLEIEDVAYNVARR